MDIMSLTAVELGKKIKAKEISVTEATQAYLDQIEKVENDVHSYVTIDKEGALKRAEEVQKMIDDGTLLSPLAGVPVAIKDNMCTKGTRTTCSSKILENFVSPFNATKTSPEATSRESIRKWAPAPHRAWSQCSTADRSLKTSFMPNPSN